MDGQTGRRPGFEYSASFIGQGRYEDCPFEVNGERRATQGWVDDVSTDFALEFIERSKSGPFLLIVGYKSPHGPWSPPERLREKYGDVEPKPPVNADAKAPFDGKFDVHRPNRPARKRRANRAAQGRHEMARNYFRTIYGVDENLGRLLDALDEHGLTQNTVVVYTSDNGFFLGEHGRGDKRAAYDESLRIPLLLRYPKLDSKKNTIDAMVLNIDLAPTILDVAGLAIPEQMQGKSWRPLFDGKSEGWREAFFYEYFFERNFAIPTILAARTETTKLIKYPGHDEWTELYDLANDPYEMNNLADDPAHRSLRRRMEAEFERQAEAVEFRIPDYADEPPMKTDD